MKYQAVIVIGVVVVVFVAAGWADQPAIIRYVVAGGGGTSLDMGSYALSGTIGEAAAGSDATRMTGGEYSLVGGFWSFPSKGCTCPGDMNSDGSRDGLDIQLFVECLAGNGICVCADMDGGQGINLGDVPAFVAQLLSGSDCP